MEMTINNLCDSCTNIGCEFQSGIVRTECAFYMPPQLEPDNYGNYVVTKDDMVAILTELQQEMDKVSFTRSNDYGVYARTPAEIRKDYSDIIQERINELKAESEDNNVQTM